MKPREPYRQYVSSIDLSLERNTPNVPADDWFYVIKDGVVVARCKSLKQALQRYCEIRDALVIRDQPKTPPDTGKSAIEEYFRQKDIYWGESHRHGRRGGKGGRGGV